MVQIGDCAVFSKTIAECDVYGFAGITGDFNPVHINKVKAEKTIFGDRVAHGMLCGSLISTVLGMYLPGPGTIYLEQRLKFKKPVYIGDTLVAKVIVTELLEHGKARLETIVKNQNEEIVISGDALVKLPE